MDNLSKQERSERMSRIKGTDTGPEMTVRRIVHGMGFRYRLHVRELPGKPDIVLPKLGKIIFVHGCFWHQHECAFSHVPKSNVSYWRPKLQRNQVRDRENIKALRSIGWKCLTLWECQMSNPERLLRRLTKFLDGPDPC